MGYGIELYFDDESNRKIRNIWTALYDEKANKFMINSNSKPHLTLKVYEESLEDLEGLKMLVESFPKSLKTFKLHFSNIGFFNTGEMVMTIMPKVTEALLNSHRTFDSLSKAYNLHGWQYYNTDQWVPHCTMALNIRKTKEHECFDILSSMFEPFEAKVTKIGLIHFMPIEQLCEYPLVKDESIEI